MALEPQIIDQYSFLDYKNTFGDRSLANPVEFWVGAEHMRRLQAYMILESYFRNSAREWLSTDATTEQKDSRREYGDAHVVVQTALSSLLGEEQKILVPEAADTEEGSPERTHQLALNDWAKKERFIQKLNSCETQACKLGDGVYVLGWNEGMSRPHLEVWDPGFYFPVWDDENPSEEFPSTIHIAYDFMRTHPTTGYEEKFLRRITWELVPLTGTIPARQRPWNGEEDTTHTVLYSDMTWRYEDVSKDEAEGPVYTLNISQAYEVEADDVDMEIDWIPVIHVANTDTDSGEHYGVSVLSPILQIVDDIISTDTDLQAASATTGSPPLVVTDLIANADEDNSITSYGPGEVISTTGDGGAATMIDTSRSLVALTGFVKDLLTRMSVNGRIPESLLGRVKPNEVPSGIALTLSFSPHSSMIRSMRLVRKNKYETLLKFVGRFMQQAGQVKGELPAAELHFGTFLPADDRDVMEIVTSLREAKAISIQTAVTILIEAGYPIEEVGAEVEKIQAEDFTGAEALVGITADPNEGLKYLGRPTIAVEEVQVQDESGRDEDDDFEA